MRERAGGEEERVGWGREERAQVKEREKAGEWGERGGEERGKRRERKKKRADPPPTCQTDRQDNTETKGTTDNSERETRGRAAKRRKPTEPN